MIKYKNAKGKICEKKYHRDVEYVYLKNKNIVEILSVEGFNDLRSFHLAGSEITEIKCLDKLTSLNELHLPNNRIKKITGLDNLINLKTLNLSNNQITEIKGLDKLTKLDHISLYNNKITEIKGLDKLINLRYLWLYNNQITEIKGLDGLKNLQNIWLSSNQISVIPFTIMNLRRLSSITIDCEIHPVIKRFLNKNHIKYGNTIYDDKQNVHDSSIVKSIKESIYNIVSESKEHNIDVILKEIIDDEILSDETKQQLAEHCQDKTFHSVLNLTFGEVLCSVWKIISEHKESDEIKLILNDEMKDSICKCFTGRLSRLVNCLNGFDSRVKIQISDTQQILGVIIRIRNKYIDDVEKQKQEVVNELMTRGFDQAVIDEYIVYLE